MRRRPPPRVFFPWERSPGLLGRLGRARLRMVVLAVIGVSAVVLLFRREEHKAAVRATRASIATASRAVESYRADHNGACPQRLGELVVLRYAREAPVDAWGRPLALTCPGRRDPRSFELASDGPDGIPGGLDRVE